MNDNTGATSGNFLMSHPILPLLALCLLATQAVANPLMLDEGNKPVTMIHEDVTIAVGAGKSLVKGSYQFKFDVEGTPGRKDKEAKHVTIFVPVFERYKNSPESIEDPVIIIGKRTLRAKVWNDLALEGTPMAPSLPPGWSMNAYVCEVPLRYLTKEFQMHLSYVQPHFEKDVVGYVPLRPPLDSKASRIVFIADPGRTLRSKSRWAWLHKSKARLQFTPKDRELIQVKSLPAPKGKAPAAG
ncbi:MAG: hypothetical protein ACAI34_16975 [Verrucomicrobium sp.]|nr:hypothetical protein [Verrucomicrobium sp.]